MYIRIEPDKNYSLESYIVLGGEPVNEIQANGSYRVEVVLDNKVMFSQNFERPVVMVFVDTLDGGYSYVTNGSIKLYTPYYSEKQKVNLYLNNVKVGSYSFEQLCNHDGRCAGEEDYLSCPSDCGSEGPNIDVYTVNDAIEEPTKVSPLVSDEPHSAPFYKSLLEYLEYLFSFWPYLC
jgi:hypothetical protein